MPSGEVQGYWANAFAKHAGPLVPTTVMGGGTPSGNGAQQLLDLITAKTARDLSLDLSVSATK